MDECDLSYLMRYYGYLDVEYSGICLKLREISVLCGSVVTVIAGLIFMRLTAL